MKYFVIYVIIAFGVSVLSFLSTMTHPDNFYIHLNSDVARSSPLQYSNSIGNFVTILSQRYQLQGEYEVALSRIHYTKSWFNIEKDQTLYLIEQYTDNVHVIPEVFPSGNYNSIEEIISTLNKLYSDYIEQLRWSEGNFEQSPVFEYNPSSNKIRIKLGIHNEQYLFAQIDHYLANFLGLTDYNDSQWPISSDNDGIIFSYKNFTKKILNSSEYQKLLESRLSLSYSPPVEQPLAMSIAENTESINIQQTNNSVNPQSSSTKLDNPIITPITTTNSVTTQSAVTPPSSILTTAANTNTTTLQSPSSNNPIETPIITAVTTQSSVTPPSSILTTTVNITSTTSQSPSPSRNNPIETPIITTNPVTTTTTTTNQSRPSVIVSSTPFSNKRKSNDTKNVKTKNVRIQSKKSNSNEPQSDQSLQPRNLISMDENAYVYGFKSVALSGYINNLNIYCNLLKPVAVGNFEVPLLRTIGVETNSKFGQFLQYEPQEREYIRVLYTEFDHIEIDVKDDYDRTIDFKFGKVYLSLHFRKITTYGF